MNRQIHSRSAYLLPLPIAKSYGSGNGDADFLKLLLAYCITEETRNKVTVLYFLIPLDTKYNKTKILYFYTLKLKYWQAYLLKGVN